MKKEKKVKPKTQIFAILVVDDDPLMAKSLVDILNVKDFQAEAVNSGEEALALLKQKTFDCLLTDIKMPIIDGVELSRRSKEIQPSLNVILMTAYAAEEKTDQALAEGAVTIVEKPIDINIILRFLSTLQDKCFITIIDDDPNFCKTLRDILKCRHFNVDLICDPHNVIESISSETQVILLDLKLNSINGVDVLREVRKNNPTLPVILITGFQKEMTSIVESAYKLNAFTCLNKPVEIEDLILSINRVRYHQLIAI